MGVLPILQTTLKFVAFVGNLIELKQFNTILVLHDHTSQNQINMLIETLTSHNDVAWMLVNDFDNRKYWKNNINKHQNQLILTVLQTENIYPTLNRLYQKNKLNKRSKNLVVLSDNFELSDQILRSLLLDEINAVLVYWTSDEAVIHAWNPYSVPQSIKLNKTEFLKASSYANLTVGKYTGLFFEQLHSRQGSKSTALAIYGGENLYNVVSKDCEFGINGVEVHVVDWIGKAIQSPIEFLVIRTSRLNYMNENSTLYKDFLERNYTTFTPIQRRNIQFVTVQRKLELIIQRKEYDIVTTSLTFGNNPTYVYGHAFENFVIVVENNTTTMATTLQRIFAAPIIYLWLLLIILFVVLRCGLQSLYEREPVSLHAKQRRCIFTCQDTVQLSCGVVMNTKQFGSHRVRHGLLVHGATIIPFIAGMFLSGILYGEYVIHSETPKIDSIAQLNQSGITVLGPFSFTQSFKRFRNKFITAQFLEIFEFIWTGNTKYAYIIPEQFASLLDMEHLRPNGRPLFHVIKERFAMSPTRLKLKNWFMLNRLDTIVLGLQEHGLMKYFESVAKRTFIQQTTSEKRSNSMDQNSLVATAGGLQEILIACGIYLIGVSFAIVIFVIEYFCMQIFP